MVLWPTVTAVDIGSGIVEGNHAIEEMQTDAVGSVISAFLGVEVIERAAIVLVDVAVFHEHALGRVRHLRTEIGGDGLGVELRVQHVEQLVVAVTVLEVDPYVRCQYLGLPCRLPRSNCGPCLKAKGWWVRGRHGGWNRARAHPVVEQAGASAPSGRKGRGARMGRAGRSHEATAATGRLRVRGRTAVARARSDFGRRRGRCHRRSRVKAARTAAGVIGAT